VVREQEEAGMRRMRVVALVMVGCTTVGLTACGAVAEKVSENATEKAIESANGGNADVDINDDGSFSVKSKDGSFAVSADGELADGFPTEVPLVEGKVEASWSSSDGDQQGWWVTLDVDDAKAAYAEAKSSLEDSGYTITGDYQGTADGQFSGNLSAEGDWVVNVAAADGDPATITYVLTTPGN
jgi:hypothetical protein